MSADRLPDLPDIATAKLPEVYASAKRALAECARIDECQTWANKAEALASYAKQAHDNELRALADRIQARAIRRCGELLREIPRGTGSHWESKRDGAVPLTRAKAAEEAGISERQRKTAIRLANIPEDEFEDAVEADDPPTVTELAELGKQAPAYDHLQGRSPEDFRQATQLIGLLHHVIRTSSNIDIGAAARGMDEQELLDARQSLQKADEWLDLVWIEIRK